MSDSADEFTVNVSLGSRSYEIAIASDHMSLISEHLQRWMKKLPTRTTPPGTAIVITDQNVERLQAITVHEILIASGWSCHRIVLKPGERSKSLSVASEMYDQLIELQADRQTTVIAVGGGVVGDTAGFVAATFARGLHFVHVPTTLLAQVDSSVGGKVAINHAQAKNMIGAFYQPLGVLIDTSVLSTLPNREYRSGLSEVVKYGVILDAPFFEYLEANVDGLNHRAPDVLRNVIARSCRLKANVVEQDEFEQTGLRSVLNYGHTFAHAFEALCGYKQLLHGEAVAIGMVYASRLAEQIQLIDSSLTDRQIALLKALDLPTQLPTTVRLETSDILDRMKLDKKTLAGQLRFVLPTKLGHVEVRGDIKKTDIRTVIDNFTDAVRLA